MKGCVIVSDNKYPLALPVGTTLSGQYVIEKVLGQGGFGITYKAIDHKNNRPVAIKEYFPDSMVYRSAATVISHPGERTEFFEFGKKGFLAEAETLAKFLGNENIVRVYSYFEENQTAYFAMEYVDGIPLDKYLRDKGGRISIEEANAILIPIMDALGAVHGAGIVHRDVSPDNIYISNDGRIMLLDFGAARYSLGDKSRSLDVVLKHGFAPKEQYSRRGKQGPFTDVYALGATYYFALTSKRPPDSIERMEEDDLVPPSTLGVKISEHQEEAILKALSVSAQDRFKSMAEFKAAMLNDPAAAVSNMQNNSNFGAYPQNMMGQGIQNTVPMQPITDPGMYSQNVTGQGIGNSFPMQNSIPNSGSYPQNMTGQSMPNNVPMQPIPNSGTFPQPMTGQGLPNAVPMNTIPSSGSYPQSVTGQGVPNAVPMPTVQNNITNAQPPVNSYPQQITPAISVPLPKPNMARNSSGKKVFIGAGVACAVIVVVIAAVMGLGSSGKKNKPSGAGIESIGITSSDSASQSVTTVSQLMDSATDNEPAGTSSTYSSKYTKSDLEIIGNTAANIKNDGCYAEEGSVRIWVDEDGHSLMSNLEDHQYLYQDQSYYFSCLSLTGGKLYFLYNDQAYIYTVNIDEKANLIDSLKGYNDIEKLYVTPAFFFIYRDEKVVRINRNTGKEEESIDIAYSDDFTFYDGWIYIVGTDSENHSALYKVREDDFNTFGDNYLYENEGYHASPCAYDGYIYTLYNNGSKTQLHKVRADFNTDDEQYTDVSVLFSGSSKNMFASDLNVIGSNVFITGYSNDSDNDSTEINRIVVFTNGGYTIGENSPLPNSYSPSVTIDSKGNYEVDCMQYDSDKKVYLNQYYKYDPNTAKDVTQSNLK